MVAIALSLSTSSIYAQETAPVRCGADEYHAEQMQDPFFASKFRAIQRHVREQLQHRTPSCASPIIIPVAVHFSGNITNANMSCIQSSADNHSKGKEI